MARIVVLVKNGVLSIWSDQPGSVLVVNVDAAEIDDKERLEEIALRHGKELIPVFGPAVLEDNNGS